MEAVYPPSTPERPVAVSDPRENWDYRPDDRFMSEGVNLDAGFRYARQAGRLHERPEYRHIVSELNGDLREEDALQKPNYSRHGVTDSPRIIPKYKLDENGQEVINAEGRGVIDPKARRDKYVYTPLPVSPITRMARALGRAAFHVPGVPQIYRLGLIAGGHGGGHSHAHNHHLTPEEMAAKEREEEQEIRERLPLNKDVYRNRNLYPIDPFGIETLRNVRANRWRIPSAAAAEWKSTNNVAELPDDVIAKIRDAAHEQAILEYAREFFRGDTSPKVLLEIRKAASIRDMRDRQAREAQQAENRRRLRYHPGSLNEAIRASLEPEEEDEHDEGTVQRFAPKRSDSRHSSQRPSPRGGRPHRPNNGRAH